MSSKVSEDFKALLADRIAEHVAGKMVREQQGQRKAIAAPESEDAAPKRRRGRPVGKAPLRVSGAERMLMNESSVLAHAVVRKDLIDSWKRRVEFHHLCVFEESMCVQVVELMAEGRSRNDAATMLGITKETFNRWCNREHKDFIPQFAEAVEIGHALSELWWDEVGRLNIFDKQFNSVLYMMNMQNRFGWTRKLEGDVTMRKVNEERRVLEIKMGERTTEHVAEVLRILHESGAVEAGTDEPSPSETD